MIGVIADPSDFSVVQEFFELFKTPWEFYREGRHYSVLLCSGDSGLREQDAQLVVIYGGAKARSDAAIAGSRASGKVSSRLLSYKGARLQLYFESFTFDDRCAKLTYVCVFQDEAGPAQADQRGGCDGIAFRADQRRRLRLPGSRSRCAGWHTHDGGARTAS